MDMTPLIAKCPKACRETVCMPIFSHNVIPPGIYALLESYCDDPECDCRRVFLNVVNKETNEILATIGYGWEDLEFYEEWFGDKSMKELIQGLKGPVLEVGGLQSEYAKCLLEHFKKYALNKESIEIWKKHYRLFKEKC